MRKFFLNFAINASHHQSSESKPTVLKYDMPVAAKDSASSGVVTTTANGCPFPMGLPIVTMSGTTPRETHSYDLACSFHACLKQSKLMAVVGQ